MVLGMIVMVLFIIGVKLEVFEADLKKATKAKKMNELECSVIFIKRQLVAVAERVSKIERELNPEEEEEEDI